MTFIDFCRQHGVLIEREPPLGVWKRYKTVGKPKHRNGAVKYLGDVGFVQDHGTMDSVAVWHPDGPVPAMAQREVARIRGDEAKRRILAVAKMAKHFFALSPLRNGHPYLEGKGLSMVGCGNLRVDGEQLVVPMYDCREDPFHSGPRLISFQTIAPDGAKKYRAGCTSQYATYPLTRKRAVVTCYAEGFATGLAVFQAMPDADVVVCFDAGNLVRVAKEVKPTGLAVVVADNDWETAERIGTNPGIQKGQEAAGAIGCGLAYPEGIKGSDWCDALQEWGERGPMRLRMQIMRAARPATG